MITLEAFAKARHACIAITFATEDAALAFMDRTQYGTGATLFITGEDHDNPIPAEYTRLIERIHPTCEHGMNAHNCYGPDHFMSAEQERAMGW